MERPKRRITSRCLEYNGGMLHEEELALRRALQASLMASKTPTQVQKTKNAKAGTKEESGDKVDDVSNVDKKGFNKNNPKTADVKYHSESMKRKSAGGKDSGKTKKQKKLLVRVGLKVPRKQTGKGEELKEEHKQRTGVSKEKRKAKDKVDKKGMKKKKKKLDGVSVEMDEQKKHNESVPRVVRAQRKFAQSNPSSPGSMLLYQSQMQPLKARAKTEDFLDFLCLRGTPRLPKSLELFNSPCAPLSPLTDDEESSKTSPSKISTNEQNSRSPRGSDGESSAKRSLNLGNECGTKSSISSTSNSTVSSPVSTRVQPHAVLPQFTSAHYGTLSNIPTPIPYPRASSTPLTPSRPQGVDAYGAPVDTRYTLPPSSAYHPCVSSIAIEMHRAPLCSRRGREGFHPVGQCLPPASNSSARASGVNSSTVATGNTGSVMTLSKKVGQSPNKNGKSVQKSPRKSSHKSPSKSPKKGITKTASGNKGTSSSPEKDTLSDDPVPLGQALNELPLFTPTEQEFKQPLKYIESISPQAEAHGICAVLPPDSWKPDFCLTDEIRFTTKFQFIHRLGNINPVVELQLAAIRKHLEQQSITLTIMPQIAGCELDLPHMSKVVQEFGGLQQIIDKRKWGKVADTLKIPKTAVERSGKLEQIYCKYLLSYDLLSEKERNELFESIKNEKNALEESLGNCSQEYMSKGRSVSLPVFQRTAKNVMEHHIRANANVKEVEKTFWRLVDEGQRYVVVHTAELPNTAFPTAKGNPFSKSKWNLNVLPKMNGSAVRDLSEIEGVSSPVVRLEMAMSASVWQTSPHGLFTIEYLHQGSDKIWYSIPSYCQEKFSQVVSAESFGKASMKDHMMSPIALSKAGVPVYRIVQKPGQFIIKFPGAYYSSLSSGYAVSDAVSLSHLSHIQRIKASFQPIGAHLKVDHLFSWERLIASSLQEELRRNSSESTLNILIPELEQIKSRETVLRSELVKYGAKKETKIDGLQKMNHIRQIEKTLFLFWLTPDDFISAQDIIKSSGKAPPCYFVEPDETINCEECKRFCFLSTALDESEKYFCLQHAINKFRQAKKSDINMTLVVRLDMSKLDELLKEAKAKLQELQRKPKTIKRRVNTGSSPGNKKDEKA